MPYFAVHDADGKLVATGTTVATDAELAERGLTAKRFTGGNAPPAGKDWNPQTRAFDIAHPAPPSRTDQLAADPEFQALPVEHQDLARVIIRALGGR
jgi:hypothetical protein